MMFIQSRKNCVFVRIVATFIILAFSVSLPTPYISQSDAQSVLNLPAPGTMISLSNVFTPPIVTGITIYPDTPLKFDFIINTGDNHLQGEELRKESKKLINYFLATLTVPEDEMWVNLSPYEKDRIIAEGLGNTEMGRDMLVQDYILKQLTASLMFPDGKIGSKFWNQMYAKAQEKFGTAEIPTNLFNKIWIVPEEASVYINGTSVFVMKSHLKVMLEEDYLALDHHDIKLDDQGDRLTLSAEAKSIFREILIPEIEREVNEGENFANLRQIYNSMILATWYKRNFKKSLLGQFYVDKNKIKGIDLEEKDIRQKVYNKYLEAFKKGVYDYIKEDYDASTQQVIPRKYFSGGLDRVHKISSDPLSAKWFQTEKENFDHAMVTVRASAFDENGTAIIFDFASAKKAIDDAKSVKERLKIIPNDQRIADAAMLSVRDEKEGQFSEQETTLTNLLGDQKSLAVKVDKTFLEHYTIIWYVNRLRSGATAGVRGEMNIADYEKGDMNIGTMMFLAQAYANYVKAENPHETDLKVFSGYADMLGTFAGFDERHHAKDFGDAVQRVLAANDIRVIVDDIRTHEDTYSVSTATPVISFMGFLHQLDGVMNGTASHNPRTQTGMKTGTSAGHQDDDATSEKILYHIEALYADGQGEGEIRITPRKNRNIISISAKAQYYDNFLKYFFTDKEIEGFKAAMMGGFSYVFDGIGGTGGTTMEYMFNRMFGNGQWEAENTGASRPGALHIINGEGDPNLLGIPFPDPSLPATLIASGLISKMIEVGAKEGNTGDGDWDRFGPATIIKEKDVPQARKYGIYVSTVSKVNAIEIQASQIGEAIGKGLLVSKIFKKKDPISKAEVDVAYAIDVDKKYDTLQTLIEEFDAPAAAITDDIAENTETYGLDKEKVMSKKDTVYIARYTPQQLFALLADMQVRKAIGNYYGEQYVDDPKTLKAAIAAGTFPNVPTMYIVTTYPSSRILERMVRYYTEEYGIDLQIIYTSVGFKNIGREIVKMEERARESAQERIDLIKARIEQPTMTVELIAEREEAIRKELAEGKLFPVFIAGIEESGGVQYGFTSEENRRKAATQVAKFRKAVVKSSNPSPSREAIENTEVSEEEILQATYVSGRDKDTTVVALLLTQLAADQHRKNETLIDAYARFAQKLGGLFYFERSDTYAKDPRTGNPSDELKNENSRLADELEKPEKAGEVARLLQSELVEGSHQVLELDINKYSLFQKVAHAQNGSGSQIVDGHKIDDEDIIFKRVYRVEGEPLPAEVEGEWQDVKVKAHRYDLKNGKSFEILHAGEGPLIVLYDKENQVESWLLIRPSGTEVGLTRIYLEIEDRNLENPNPHRLIKFAKPFFEFMGLADEYLPKLQNTLDKKYSDAAMLTKQTPEMKENPSPQHGGIDFNPNNLNLNEEGQEMKIDFPSLDFQNIQKNTIHGIQPVIINITPVVNFPLLLGELEEEADALLSHL